MKTFIDFDDVLFNTKKFRQDFVAIFLRQGISQKDFDSSYALTVGKNDGCKVCYDPQKQITRLKKYLIFNDEELAHNLKIFLADLKRYVFKDVCVFLEKFQKKELFLVTYGDATFQKTKVSGSGVEKYFKKVIIASGEKSNGISKFISAKEKMYFVDDRVRYISEVKKVFPEIKTFLLKRKAGRYTDEKNKYCDFECNRLSQVEKIIETKNGK